MRQLLTRFEHS